MANKNVVITLTEVYTVTFVKPKEDVKMPAGLFRVMILSFTWLAAIRKIN